MTVHAHRHLLYDMFLCKFHTSIFAKITKHYNHISSIHRTWWCRDRCKIFDVTNTANTVPFEEYTPLHSNLHLYLARTIVKKHQWVSKDNIAQVEWYYTATYFLLLFAFNFDCNRTRVNKFLCPLFASHSVPSTKTVALKHFFSTRRTDFININSLREKFFGSQIKTLTNSFMSLITFPNDYSTVKQSTDEKCEKQED